jgi:hypothetical protein
MIQHVVIAVIFFFAGMAWGWGMCSMMVANHRRKRIFETRTATTGTKPEVKQAYRMERSYGVIKADATGKLYFDKFDA